MTDAGVVLVTSRSFSSGAPDGERELTDAGLRVVRGSPGHEMDELVPVLHEAVGWIAGTAPITDAHLAAAPGLKVVARYGAGVDSVDLAACARRGVRVTNTPGANSEAVADLAMALLLAMVRGLVAADRDARAGVFRVIRGRDVGALTLGLVGFGRIGKGVARRAAGFGCRVLVSDPYVDAADVDELGASLVGGDQLVTECDAVSLHAPGGQTLVNAGWLDRLRHHAVLVNTARADLVDESAVVAALRSERLAGYATDTFSGEAGGAGSDLLATDLANRVIVTPHIGAQTREAIDQMGAGAVNAVLDVLAGHTPPTIVGSVGDPHE